MGVGSAQQLGMWGASEISIVDLGPIFRSRLGYGSWPKTLVFVSALVLWRQQNILICFWTFWLTSFRGLGLEPEKGNSPYIVNIPQNDSFFITGGISANGLWAKGTAMAWPKGAPMAKHTNKRANAGEKETSASQAENSREVITPLVFRCSELETPIVQLSSG